MHPFQVVNYEPNTAARMHTPEIEAGFAKHGFEFDRELQDRIWRKPGPFKLEGQVLSTFGSAQVVSGSASGTRY